MSDCRECSAGYAQATSVELAWRCNDHGVVSLSDYVRPADDAAQVLASAVEELSVADDPVSPVHLALAVYRAARED